jgi:hypothetical protein
LPPDSKGLIRPLGGLEANLLFVQGVLYLGRRAGLGLNNYSSFRFPEKLKIATATPESRCPL